MSKFYMAGRSLEVTEVAQGLRLQTIDASSWDRGASMEMTVEVPDARLDDFCAWCDERRIEFGRV